MPASILIADDEECVRRVLYLFLKQSGHSVTVYDPNVPDPSLLLKPYDAAIFDINMPGKTGFELRDELLKHSPETPVIFITGETDAWIAEKALEQSGTLIKKPFGADQIRDAVCAALKNA